MLFLFYDIVTALLILKVSCHEQMNKYHIISYHDDDDDNATMYRKRLPFDDCN